MKIRYGAVLPLPPDDAFAFVADPVNWPLFFPGVRSVAKDDDWGRIGGHARLTSVILGRSLTMNLELTVWAPPKAFRYTVSQGGKPGNDDNWRIFEPVAGGTRLTGTTELPARPGATQIHPPGPGDLVGDREKRGSAYEQLIAEAEEVGVTCGRLLHRRAV